MRLPSQAYRPALEGASIVGGALMAKHNSGLEGGQLFSLDAEDNVSKGSTWRNGVQAVESCQEVANALTARVMLQVSALLWISSTLRIY